MFPALLAAIGLALGAWAFWIEPSRLVVKQATLSWTGLQGPPLRIALLSDLHIGAPHMGLARLRQVVDTVNREAPDLVLIAGDFVIAGVLGGRFVEPEAIAAELKGLQSRLGTVAVLGNHDWWYDGARVGRALQTAGITVLENDAVRIENGAASFWIAGLADRWSRGEDLPGALGKVPDLAPLVVLAHNPDIFPEVPARVNLVLAGHTHGGQVKFPLLGAPIVPSQYGQRYASGLVVEQGREMYVTTGIGTSILPVRFRVPPEIAILTLAGR